MKIWLDEHGIAHDGSPPTDSVEVGGRWYSMRQILRVVPTVKTVETTRHLAAVA